MAFPPFFDVVGTWVKPVVAETTGMSAPAKRQAATPRRDQRLGSDSALVAALICELSTTPSLGQYCGGMLPMILHRQMNAHRTDAGGWHGTRDH
jgi:hypothetical protein